MNIDRPQIPLTLFRKLALTLTPEELNKIPADRLPEQIPMDLLNTITKENATKIDELMMRRHQQILLRRRKLTDALGAETAAACYTSERRDNESPAFTLKQMLRSIQPRRTKVSQAKNATTAIELLKEMQDARTLAVSVREDINRLLHYRKILRPKLFHPCEYQQVVRDADARLANFIDQDHDILGRYYADRAMLCLTIMESYSKMRETYSGIREEMEKRIKKLDQRLTSARTESSLANQSSVKTPYIERLSDEIRVLFSKLRIHDITLHESDLTQWLDAVMDISLYRRVQDVYDNIATRAEDELANLVRVYFIGEKLNEREKLARANQAEISSENLSVNQQAALFLQRYLQTKQQEMASHHGISAADRLYAYKRVERRLSTAIRSL